MRATVLFFVMVSFLVGPIWSEEGVEFTDAKVFEAPIREHSIIVTEEGFYPDRIAIFTGEKIRFFVTSTLDDPSCFLIEDKDLFLGVSKGKISEGEVFFDRAGSYKFHCPSGKIEGKISVLPKKDKAERKIASEHRPRVWRPREYPTGY